MRKQDPIGRYVYILQCGGDFYKIGVAADVEKRVLDLSVGNPLSISIVFKQKLSRAAYALERRLHAKFKHVCHKGEWFRLDHLDLAQVKGWIDHYELTGELPSLSDTTERREQVESIIADTLPEISADVADLPSLAEMSRRYLQDVLIRTGYNRSRAARILKIDRKTLYRLESKGI